MAQKMVTKEIEDAINKTPYRSQDGKKLDAKVIARYFGGPITTYVLEGYQLEGETWDGDSVFGLQSIGYGFEYGSIPLKELFETGYYVECNGEQKWRPIERDTSVEPLKMTLGECAAMYGEKLPAFLYKKDDEDGAADGGEAETASNDNANA